jgi:hypothetical protein
LNGLAGGGIVSGGNKEDVKMPGPLETDIQAPGIHLLMLAEIKEAIQNATLYLPPHLENLSGQQAYPLILENAARNHSAEYLADELRKPNILRKQILRNGLPGTQPRMDQVPKSAADHIARREFNDFYMRAVCRFAIESAVPNVILCQANVNQILAKEIEPLIGQSIPPSVLLDTLRSHNTIESFLNIPPKTNVELTVKLPEIS